MGGAVMLLGRRVPHSTHWAAGDTARPPEPSPLAPLARPGRPRQVAKLASCPAEVTSQDADKEHTAKGGLVAAGGKVSCSVEGGRSVRGWGWGWGPCAVFWGLHPQQAGAGRAQQGPASGVTQGRPQAGRRTGGWLPGTAMLTPVPLPGPSPHLSPGAAPSSTGQQKPLLSHVPEGWSPRTTR